MVYQPPMIWNGLYGVFWLTDRVFVLADTEELVPLELQRFAVVIPLPRIAYLWWAEMRASYM